MADGAPVVNTNLYQPPPGGGLLGGMGVLDIMRMRQIQNQNLLFQNQMDARQRMGAIAALGAASGASMMDTIKAFESDPKIAAFGGEFINIYRQNALAQAQYENQRMDIQGKELSQSNDAMTNFRRDMTLAAMDPSRLAQIRDTRLGILPPEMRPGMKKAYDSLIESVTGGADLNTPEGRQLARGRALTVAMAGGVTPDAAYASVGMVPPTLRETGGVMGVYGGMGAGGGGGGVPPLGGAPGGAGVLPGAATAPKPPGSPPGSPPATLTSPIGFPGPHLWQPTLATDEELSHHGEPLSGMAPGPQMPQSLLAGTVTGESARDKLKAFNDQRGEAGQFQNATIAHARMLDVQNDIWELAKNGGVLTPGAMGTARENLAKLVSTVQQITGHKPSIDPNALASAQDLIKNTRVLGMSLLTSFFGSQREASETIQSAMGAVPGIENTPRGAMMIGDIIDSVTQWQMGQRKFRQDYQKRNYGDLADSDVLYAQKNPVEGLVQQVIDKYKSLQGIPDGAIVRLSQNPNERGLFEQKYGAGKSNLILGPPRQ